MSADYVTEQASWEWYPREGLVETYSFSSSLRMLFYRIGQLILPLSQLHWHYYPRRRISYPVNTKFSSWRGNLTCLQHPKQGHTLFSNTSPSRDQLLQLGQPKQETKPLKNEFITFVCLLYLIPCCSALEIIQKSRRHHVGQKYGIRLTFQKRLDLMAFKN